MIFFCEKINCGMLDSDKLDVDDHYIAWRQSHDTPGVEYQEGDGPFSFCTYPFLLNPRAKSKLLHTEARLMMNHTIQQVLYTEIYTLLIITTTIS